MKIKKILLSATLEFEMKNIMESHAGLVSRNQVLQQRVQDLESQGKQRHQEEEDDENL